MSEKSIFGASSANKDEGTHWLSVSDLMAALMMIFLFIAISFMRHVAEQKAEIERERDQIKQVVVIANDTQIAILEALKDEFHNDLKKWHAELDEQNMTVRFKEPEVLFAPASANLKPEFEDILDDFFPRYVRRLDEFRDAIAELRVEGHTSREWNARVSAEEAYFKNMTLSQERTRSVLRYCLSLEPVHTYPWLQGQMAAVGLSSSKLVRDALGVEDSGASRRVEFTVKTNFERRIIEAVMDQAGAR